MQLQARYDIRAYEGILDCQFGMTIAQIHTILGFPDSSFKKAPTSECPTDAYDRLGFHIFYEAPGVCNAIEMFSPAQPTFNDHLLIGQPFSELKTWIQAIDPNVEVDEVGLISYQLGFGLYAPFAGESPNDPVESAIVFERGYYD